MRHPLFITFLTALLVGVGGGAKAEDIDLFINPNSNVAASTPNVLFVIDNTANWSGAFTNEMAAISSIFNNMPVNKFRVGIMFSTETGSGNSGNDGGYVRAAIRLMNATNKTAYANLITSIDKNGDKGNGGKSSLVMAEAYSYFSSGTPYAGNSKAKTDYTGNNGGTTSSNAVYALAGNALASKDATQYANPITDSCQKNFIIYISNGAAQDNSTVTSQSSNLLAAAGGDTTTIPLSPSGSQGNMLDEWARFMKKSTLAITTYTIDVDPVTTGQGPGWTTLLKSTAEDPSRYFSVSSSSGSTQITAAINSALSQIQSVNSVFAAVSLPVSVNTQGTYLNQVFIGQFRPDAGGLPRWAGNLKQYKLGMINNSLQLEDADAQPAINTNTGFITECARSYWTPVPNATTPDTYWSFNPQGNCLATPNTISNSPDGNFVEKGGQGYAVRATPNRVVKTCTPSSSTLSTLCVTTSGSTNLANFDSSNTTITQAKLGAASTTEKNTLINWQHGLDTEDENHNGVTDATSPAETRPSVHGDVLHSRPIALNFGTAGTPSVVVFYGGNDGVLRAINGNRSANFGSTGAGSELWAFVPPEFFGSIKRLHDDSTPINYVGSTSGSPKPYGIDGPISAYLDASSPPTIARLYATMRRGGRAIYSFDVTSPANPILKWHIGCPPSLTDSSQCSTNLTGIGQTWSTPTVLKSATYPTATAAGTSPLLIMGGGYDTCEDSDPNSCTTSTKGNKIYVLDGLTGSVLQTMSTDRAVVADVTVVPNATTGLADYAYAVDLGGNIYRITIGSAATGSWTITKIASLGCNTTPATTTCAANRKFMFAPDIVQENGTNIVLVGSGDREKPVLAFASASSVTNYYFRVTDSPLDANWLASEVSNCGVAIICKASLLEISSSTPTTAALATKKGWYLDLAATEQVVTSSVTVYGTTTFSTQTPAVPVAGSCTSNLGTSKAYNLAYTDASNSSGPRFVTVSGGGLAPSPKAGIVTLDDGSTIRFLFGGSSSSSIAPTQPPLPTTSMTNLPKKRLYWYIQK